jgi:hypothetical protein
VRGLRNKLFGSRRRKIVSTLLALSLLGAGVGIAAWAVISNGTARGGVGTLAAPTVVQGTTATYDLVPNSAAFTGSYAVKVTNPNAAQLFIKSMSLPDIAADVTWTASGGLVPASCTTAILKPHLSAQAKTFGAGAGLPVNGSGTNGGITEVVIPAVIKADDTTPNACQGATLNNLPAPSISFETAP